MATGFADLLEEALVKMTASEKVVLMERIWSSLDQQGQTFQPPAWHGAELAQRRAKLEAGNEEVMDIEEAEAYLNRNES